MSQAVLAYGCNMCSGRFRQYKVTPEGQGRAAALTGYRLRFNKKSKTDGSGKANVERDAGSQIWGVLYTISERELQLLDEGEIGYNRVRVPVQIDGAETEAWVYIASRPDRDPSLKPYSWYNRFLGEGAREHRIPVEYLAGLEQIAARLKIRIKRVTAKSVLSRAVGKQHREALWLSFLCTGS
jgi:gamma-glutamylcyclotransferase